MKLKCRSCGDWFVTNKETDELYEEGEMTLEQASICDECFMEEQNPGNDYSDYSDADSGL